MSADFEDTLSPPPGLHSLRAGVDALEILWYCPFTGSHVPQTAGKKGGGFPAPLLDLVRICNEEGQWGRSGLPGAGSHTPPSHPLLAPASTADRDARTDLPLDLLGGEVLTLAGRRTPCPSCGRLLGALEGSFPGWQKAPGSGYQLCFGHRDLCPCRAQGGESTLEQKDDV